MAIFFENRLPRIDVTVDDAGTPPTSLGPHPFVISTGNEKSSVRAAHMQSGTFTPRGIVASQQRGGLVTFVSAEGSRMRFMVDDGGTEVEVTCSKRFLIAATNSLGADQLLATQVLLSVDPTHQSASIQKQ